MQGFYIIADDLTGANDAGVQLSKFGVPSMVLLDFNEASLASAEQVPIIDTDSRAMTEETAYETVHKASALFEKQGYNQVYKKIDSTLRGNVVPELAAVVSVHQPDIVVIASAYPKMNRRTINGYQYVNGCPVSETEFGKDPKTPVKESFIPAILEKYINDQIIILDHLLLGETPETILHFISEKIDQERVWFVCDAKTDEDLKMVAFIFAQMDKKIVWAGSAGLIEYLPDALQLERTTSNPLENMTVTKTLTVSGSLSDVTKKQLDHIKSFPKTFFIEMDPVMLMKGSYHMSDILAKMKENQNSTHIILFVDSSIENRMATKRLGVLLSLNDSEVSGAISKELGNIAKVILEHTPEMNGLVLTGGDTAKAVCMQLNMNEMHLYSEIEAGLPLGKLCNATQTYWAVTKAGGFGNEHSLLNTLKFMTKKVSK